MDQDILGGRTWKVEQSEALAFLKKLPDRCVSMAFTSGPYESQRLYLENGEIIQEPMVGQAWVDFMRPIVVECCRVSEGLAFFNMASPVRGGSYTASVEWLVADLTRLDGLICGPAPFAWVKSKDFDDAPGNGIPGSGNDHYQRRDWEPIYAFCLPGRQPTNDGNPNFWSDNTCYGRAPRYQKGGEFSHRGKDGSRANDPWKTESRGPCPGPRRKNGDKPSSLLAHSPGSNRGADGKRKKNRFGPAKDGSVKGGHPQELIGGDNPIANPGNVIADSVIASDVLRCDVGGGKMGDAVAHLGEAPMALGVASRFVCWYAKPGGIVLDPFVGTGTTIKAAVMNGRRGLGCDLRQSQIEITKRRMESVSVDMFSGIPEE